MEPKFKNIFPYKNRWAPLSSFSFDKDINSLEEALSKIVIANLLVSDELNFGKASVQISHITDTQIEYKITKNNEVTTHVIDVDNIDNSILYEALCVKINDEVNCFAYILQRDPAVFKLKGGNLSFTINDKLALSVGGAQTQILNQNEYLGSKKNKEQESNGGGVTKGAESELSPPQLDLF